MISAAELQKVGQEAREANAIIGSLDLPGKNVRGCCIEITDHIIETLRTNHGIPDDALVKYRCNIGESMELHYAVGIHADYVAEEDSDGFVIVDASIDQYCDEQVAIHRVETTFGPYESIPRVAVLPVGDGRRQHWYNDPTGEHDPDSEFRPEQLTQSQ